jgi:outer membrane protein
MRKTLIALAAVATLVAPQFAAAQDKGDWIVRARAVRLDSVNKDSTGLGLTINNKWLPEVDITRFITPNVAVELVLTVPQSQTVYSNGTDIGSFKHLPPTLTAQYHFTDLQGFRPYVGAGLNYTSIHKVRLPAGVTLEHKSVGFALQAGVDIPLQDGWLFNVDVKKVQIGTDVFAGGVKAGTLDLNPTLIGIGFGKRF